MNIYKRKDRLSSPMPRDPPCPPPPQSWGTPQHSVNNQTAGQYTQQTHMAYWSIAKLLCMRLDMPLFLVRPNHS